MFGKILICYVSALLISFILLIIVNSKWIYLGTFCTFAGHFLYFSTMACFSFLNLMGFDMYFNITGNRRNTQSKKRFRLYLAYGFGFPAFFLLLLILLDQTNLYMTSIGKNHCFFDGKLRGIFYQVSSIDSSIFLAEQTDIWFFQYAPILLVLGSNTFFFIKTASHIRKTKQEIAQKDKNKNETENYWIFVRLFLLMGLTWSLEMLSQITKLDIFHITDVLNCFQGVMIFFSFVWHGKTKNLIKDK